MGNLNYKNEVYKKLTLKGVWFVEVSICNFRYIGGDWAILSWGYTENTICSRISKESRALT